MALTFDPNDPFPNLPEDSHSYAEAQAHAAQVDAWLGVQVDRVEAELGSRPSPPSTEPSQQLWIGLPAQAMQTPYLELRQMLARLDPRGDQSVVDLGAGYGRMGLVIASHFPGTRFLGYEYVQARVAEGNACYLRNGLPDEIRLLQEDLSRESFMPESADFYFIYDYGTREAIAKTLEDLKRIASKKAITVVGRGRAARDAIERHNPWLSQVNKPLHCGNYSIYRN